MARKDDPEDLDPYPGDPWHPAWEPEEREVGENDIDTPAEGSSVERVYEALRSLGDDNVEVTEPASPGVVADVGSLQTSGGGTESAADVAVAWDTTNVDEERRREAAAATFAGEDLKAVASDFAADVDEAETSATAQESARRDEQVEEAERDWVYGEMTTLERDLAESEAQGLMAASAEEAVRSSDQIESAAAGEAGEAARTLEASYIEFESFRESAELEGEETRRASGFEAAEAGDFDDRMKAVEADLVTAEDKALADDEARHAQRSLAAGDQVLGAEAGEVASGFASGLAADMADADESVAEDEASRSESQIEVAEAGEFAESMAATQLDLGDDLDASEAIEKTGEEARFQEQLVDAVIVEEELAEASASERMAAVEERLRFGADIEERFALDAELAKVEEAALPAIQDAAIGADASVPGDSKESGGAAQPSRLGWLRRVFGGGERDPAATEEPEPERVGSDDSTVDGDDAAPVELEEEAELQVQDEDPSVSVVGESASPAAEDGGDDEDAVVTGAKVDVSFAGAFEPSEIDDEIPDFAAFTSEQYIQSSTEEYAGLAEAVARAAEADSGELAAIAAPIPGLDTGVVGLDDVAVADVVDQTGPELPRRSNLALRVLTALGLLGIFLGSLVFEVTIGLLVLVILLVGASELYTVLIRSGYRPIALFGFVGILSAQVGTWIWGIGAVPVAVIVTLAATALLIGVSPARHKNLENLALTVLVMIWIGGLGAFAFAMISSPHFRWLIGAVVVTTALMDVAQFFVGRRIGKHRLTGVSPKKTVEGLIGGLIVAILVGIGFGFYRPFDLASGLALGAVVAVVAPFGDLAVSVMKRSIGVKDMGSVLPGHGGILDRIDALIFVLPAAWIVFRAAGLLG